MSDLNPRMITLARESRGLSQTALARSSGITQGALSKAERGNIEPSDKVIDKIAAALDYPVSFFMQDRRIEDLPPAFYRKRKTIPRKVLKQIVAKINIACHQVDNMLQSVEIVESSIPFYTLSDPPFRNKPERVANRVREVWRLASGPILNLTALLESKGILVIPAEFEKVDGISVYNPSRGLPPIVFVNTNVPGDRLRFTLAHELGHIVMHHHLLDPGDDVEDEAHAFAAEFMMPYEDIGYNFNQTMTLKKLIQLKPYWKMSIGSMIQHAFRHGKITPSKHRYMWMQMGRYGYRTEEPCYIEPEEPQLVRDLVDYHLKDLGYSQDELSEAINTFRGDWVSQPTGLHAVS